MVRPWLTLRKKSPWAYWMGWSTQNHKSLRGDMQPLSLERRTAWASNQSCISSDQKVLSRRHQSAMDQTNGFSCEAIEKALLETTTCLLDDMLSTPLAPQIMQQRHPPRFIVPKFTIYDGTTDLFDHLMHYCQVMALDIGDYVLQCKVFPVITTQRVLFYSL